MWRHEDQELSKECEGCQAEQEDEGIEEEL